ncbi:MAG: hypothetical protein HDR47_01575 [Bacteroides sp.]|nr:hypothetical protein [Bacteroides sp.]
MGLISWIKIKYYNHKLSQADKSASNGEIAQAKLIYESLLGKQPLADAHLAKMLVDNASNVSEKLDVLRRLLELRQTVCEESNVDFNSTLNKHVSSIESLASSCFSAENYKDAVDLMVSIRVFRNDKQYFDKVNRYKAYYSFKNANAEFLQAAGLFKDTVQYLNSISYAPISEIKELIKILEKQNRFARGIKFLVQLQPVGNWVKDIILDYIVNVISNNDSEIKNVKHLNDFCSDKKICQESAADLYKRSLKKAQTKEYTTAVLYDRFASEYLSQDNAFNFDRCSHILEELSSRADASEIKKLSTLAQSLKLSSTQLSKLEKRINEIAVAANPDNAIAICRLYIGTPSFDKMYLEKALSLAKAGGKIDVPELRRVINNQTDEISLPNTLAPFVVYLPALEQEFVDSAIVAIKLKDSTELLDKYWKVRNDSRFIASLINKSIVGWKKFANHIAANHNLYLDKKTFIEVFCDSIRDTDDLELILDLSEKILKAGKNVKDFYIFIILKYSKLGSNVEDSLDLVNRGLSHVKKDKLERLLLEKKRLISRLIKDRNFDRAESEIKSILETDDEASTLLAELYYKRAQVSKDADEKSNWLYEVLDVNEGYSLHDRFNRCLQDSLTSLCDIAKTFCKSGDKEKAFGISERISTYWSYWIPLYVYLRGLSKEPEATLNDTIKFDAETLKKIVSNCPSCKDYDSDLFRSLWNSYSAAIILKSQSQPLDKAIKALSTLKKVILTYAPASFVSEKEPDLTKLIVKLKWELANEYEHDQSFNEAVKLYDEVVADKIQSYKNRAELRSLICHVKANNVDAATEGRIYEALQLRSYQALREDLAYRFACYLLEHTRPADAEKLLRDFLPDEKALLDICENIYVKEAEVRLSEFNQLVKKLNDGKMTFAEAVAFKTSLRIYKKQIAGKLTDLSKEFAKFGPLVEAYILSKMFEEEAYKEILDKLMQENPNYIEDDTDFRNIAIASLGLVESDIKDEAILKRAIATCLTAIYTDRLFVTSLDYTSWDDKYEFTLDGSLGQTDYDNYDELPENVNFNSPADNNIAIKDVQNSLLTRLETSVRKYHPKLETFCNNEKDALDKIIELRLDKSYILASPQLCRTLASIRMSIENAFEYELGQDYGNREDVIALGCAYGFSGPEYREYSKGYNALLFCKSALSPNPSVTVPSAFTADKVSQIKKYKRLASDLKSAVGTAMNTDIKDKMNFKTFLNKYEVICKTVGDTTLSLTCSNYVNGEVVHLLNEDRMELREGVGYMVRIYNIAPSNFQAKTNLEGILCNLVALVEEKGLTADRNALNKALSNTGNSFKAAVDDAIIQAKLSAIVDKVNNNKMKNNTALSEVYKLYQKNPDNARICENLVTLCEMCIFEYVINDAYGASSVKTTLNSLQRNMSPTFRVKASKLSKAYNEIWGTLPLTTKMLLSGRGGALGESLSDKGYALKAGLDYLKTLGSVRSSRRRLDGLSFLDDVDLPF